MKHKLGLLGFSYLLGLVCAAFFKDGYVFVMAAIFLVCGLFCFIRKKKTGLVIFCAAFSAALLSGLYTCFIYCPAVSLDGKISEINGTVTDVTTYSNDTAAYTVKADISGVNTKITVFSSDVSCEIGDNINFRGKLSKLRNNSNFAEESYYKSKGIFLKAYPSSSVNVSKGKGFSLKALMTNFSDYISDKIDICLTGDEGDILKAMFLGDKSGLSDSLSSNIKRAGISHFTAVSGLHLTVIGHILMLILTLTPLKNHRYFRFIILSILILAFTIFFKLSASVVRAGVMLIICYGAEPFMRKGSTVNSMGAAVLAITLFQPYACLDIGFLLSLTGTFGIGVMAPYFCKRVKRNRFYGLKSLLIGSLCATLCTFPLSCYFFGGISTVGIIMNLLLYPLFFPALIFTVLFILSLGMGTGLLLPAGILAKAMIFLINFFGGLKYAYIPLNNSYIIYISAVSIIFTIVVYYKFEDYMRTAMAIGLSLCVLIGSVTFTKIYDSGKIKVSMYSDGDAACVIVKRDFNAYVAASDDSSKNEQFIKEYMQNEFLDELNSLALLKSDNNNIGTFENIPCKFFSPPMSKDLIASEKGDIKILNDNEHCTIEINNITIAVSPASKPLDADISVLYGYKKSLPQLSGRVYCSNRRINAENTTNIYYESVNFYITEKGILEKIN